MENRNDFNNAEQVSGGAGSFWSKVKAVVMTIVNFCKWIGSYVFRMRKLIMSIPVVLAAVRLAQYNASHLPEQVGLNLQANGEYAYMIARDAAVLGPLALTAFCLLLVFLSRRTVYPWVISIFTLTVPLLILFTNIYPG